MIDMMIYANQYIGFAVKFQFSCLIFCSLLVCLFVICKACSNIKDLSFCWNILLERFRRHSILDLQINTNVIDALDNERMP